MVKKLSQGIKFYLFTFIVCLMLSVSQAWYRVFEYILKVGINTDKGRLSIEQFFNKLFYVNPSLALYRFIGLILGCVLAGIIILGVYELRSWARKLLLLTTIFSLIIFFINLSKILNFYFYIFKTKLWLGCYLFGGLIFTIIVYLISILVFFSNKNVKGQFV